MGEEEEKEEEDDSVVVSTGRVFLVSLRQCRIGDEQIEEKEERWAADLEGSKGLETLEPLVMVLVAQMLYDRVT